MTRSAGLRLTGTCISCVQCSEVTVRRYTVPKVADSWATKRARRMLVDLTGNFHETYLYGSRYAMSCVDDFAHSKMIFFFECTGGITAALGGIIDMHVAPSNIKIGIIRTDGGVVSSMGVYNPCWPSSAFATIVHLRTYHTSMVGSSSGAWACYATRLSHR